MWLPSCGRRPSSLIKKFTRVEDLIGVEARPALSTALECFVGEGGATVMEGVAFQVWLTEGRNKCQKICEMSVQVSGTISFRGLHGLRFGCRVPWWGWRLTKLLMSLYIIIIMALAACCPLVTQSLEVRSLDKPGGACQRVKILQDELVPHHDLGYFLSLSHIVFRGQVSRQAQRILSEGRKSCRMSLYIIMALATFCPLVT